MSKWRNLATGAVVSVDDSKDARFDAAWERADVEKPKATPRRRSTKKSDNK